MPTPTYRTHPVHNFPWLKTRGCREALAAELQHREAASDALGLIVIDGFVGVEWDRFIECLQRQGGFWWESPGGDRLFVWNNDHYMTATTMLNLPNAKRREAPAQNRLLHYTGHSNPFSDLWVDFEAEVPALGYALYRIQQLPEPVLSPCEEEGRIAETDFYRAEVDERGRIRSLIDKELDRELATAWH